MKQEDIDAIHHGIAKYDRYAHGFAVELGASGCELCHEYGKYNCKGCPIFCKTGHDCCRYTPYGDIAYCHMTFLHRSARWCQAVEEEIEFLISLLPEKEQRRYDLEEI